MADPRYRVAFLDWLACAVGGGGSGRRRRPRALGDPVAALATAGHVLDYDDTYLPGIAHLSAPTAPAALVVGAERGRGVGEVLDAYAAGFEAMGRSRARATRPCTTAASIRPRPAAAWARPRPRRGSWGSTRSSALGRGHRPAGRGRTAGRVRVGRQVAPGGARVGGRRARGAAGRGRGAGAARGGRARVRRGVGGALRRAGPRGARDRRELDQGLALLPPDARRRSRPPQRVREAGGGRGRGRRASRVAPGGRGRARARRRPARRSSRSPT